MTPPLVSVLIPAYNHALYVGSTINSIMAQDYANVELITIDDGSKDNTLEVIESMRERCEQRFIRFHVETQENQGTCVTLNKLFSLAKGDYVLLIASDDELLPNAITSLVEKLKQTPEAGLVVGRNVIMDGDGKTCYWDAARNNVYDPAKAKYLSFSDFLDATNYPTTHPKWGTYEALIQCNHIPNGHLIRKSVLDKIPPFTKEAPLEDWWLMLQIAKISKIVSIDKETFRYRWHTTNTIKQTEKVWQYHRKTMECEEKYITGLKDKTWIRLFRLAQRKARIARLKAATVRLKAVIVRFLFLKKTTRKGRRIVKICRIPVYVSRCK